jgi:hypothetical protein
MSFRIRPSRPGGFTPESGGLYAGKTRARRSAHVLYTAFISLIRRYLVFIFSQGSYSVFIARAQFSVEYRLLWIPADYWTNKRASFSKSHIGSEGFW